MKDKYELLDKETALTVAEKIELLERRDCGSGDTIKILLRHLKEEHGIA